MSSAALCAPGAISFHQVTARAEIPLQASRLPRRNPFLLPIMPVEVREFYIRGHLTPPAQGSISYIRPTIFWDGPQPGTSTAPSAHTGTSRTYPLEAPHLQPLGTDLDGALVAPSSRTEGPLGFG